MELSLSFKKATQRTFAEVVPTGRPRVISALFRWAGFSGAARVGFSPIISAPHREIQPNQSGRHGQ
ncbi:hypothetical protein, partial [uncultured Rikenella sp.]|uniref:hypothetical protein n=1 Tax=uncultured Rikenella sp. TaxID=368003 RepID=UPI00262EFF89